MFESLHAQVTHLIDLKVAMNDDEIAGTHGTVSEKLKSVGVPADAMPVNEESEIQVDKWLKWIEKQKEAETKKRNAPPPLRLDDLLLYKPDALAQLVDSTAAHYGRKRPYCMIG